MTTNRIVAVIPARLGASRFPGKPLTPIAGLPMVEMVRRRVALSDTLDAVYVATCDREIALAVEGFGGQAIMTRDDHERCTDRVEEAAADLDADIVVIVQGDEPLFDPALIDMLVRPLVADQGVLVTNLLSVIASEADLADEDVVKAACDAEGFVMYYSRAPIPFRRVRRDDTPMLRQTGLSAFRSAFLATFAQLPATPLEIAESVDFLRIREHGYQVLGVVWDRQTAGVDRPEDVEVIERALRDDPFQRAIHERIV